MVGLGLFVSRTERVIAPAMPGARGVFPAGKGREFAVRAPVTRLPRAGVGRLRCARPPFRYSAADLYRAALAHISVR